MVGVTMDEQRYDVIQIPGAGEVRVYPPEPLTDDASPMYVLDVLGVTVLVRRRANEDSGTGTDTYVHVDNDGWAPGSDYAGPLRWEVMNGGECGGD